jgi:hypothetical protein
MLPLIMRELSLITLIDFCSDSYDDEEFRLPGCNALWDLVPCTRPWGLLSFNRNEYQKQKYYNVSGE